MSTAEAARALIARFAQLTPAQGLPEDGAGLPPAAAHVWTLIRQRAASDPLAQALLQQFAATPHSAALQPLLAALLSARFSAAELAELSAGLNPAPGGVVARIEADQESHIRDSGHKIVGLDGPANLSTRATNKSTISNSPITIIGGAAARQPVSAQAATPVREPLPATLSADGVHFSYGHALLIGVASYRDAALNVAGATTSADARELANLLKDAQSAAYPPDQVRLLCDHEATRVRILEELARLAGDLEAAADKNRTALILFAGHGVQLARGYALLPHDAVLQDPATTALPDLLFQMAIERVRRYARRLVIILNCCYAGGVGDLLLDVPATPAAGAAPPAEFYRPLATGSGQVVISSSRPEQRSAALAPSNSQHTLFGAHLLDALRGKAPGAGPGIGVFELFSYLRRFVAEEAASMRNRGAGLRQEPLFYASQLDDNIALALRPPGSSIGTLSAPSDQLTRLMQLELQIEAGGHVTPGLLAARDALLMQITGAA